MMQSKVGKTTGNLAPVKSVAPNSSGHRHFPFQADFRKSVMKLLRWFILLCLDLGVHVSLSFLPLLYTLSDYLAAAAKSLQSCPTLRPHRRQPTRLPCPGILQARTLEWVAISFSNAWKWKVKGKSLSCVRLLGTPWTEPTRLLHPWGFPGKSTGVGCHCLLRQITLRQHKFVL